MYVRHLQEYLDKFTEGQNGMRGNAVSDAKIYIMTRKGYLEEIKRIEVHESNNPLDTSLRVVLKPNREEKLILPPGIYQGLLMEIICYVFIVLWVMGMTE